MAAAKPEDTVNLTNCDREAIHLIGTIQPHGVLLAADWESRLITHASENSGRLLGKETQQLLGSSLDPFLTGRAGSFLEDCSTGPAPGYHYLLSMGGAKFHASIYRSGSHAIVELEPATDEEAVGPLQTGSFAGRWIERLETCNDWRDVVQTTAAEVRRLTGYDRVMVYRFAEDNHGWVVGEIKRDDWEPYLDLHYPATDIPQPARRLLLLHPLRQIADVGAAEVPVLGIDGPGPGAGTKLDLTHSSLRQPSSIHLEYLQNMGVGASFTASIIIKGKLWGLIACHHGLPFQLSQSLQADVLTIAQLVGRRLTFLEAHAALQHQAQRSALESRLLHAEHVADQAGEDGSDRLLADLIRRFLDEALALTGCDGVGFHVGENLHIFGQTPARATVQALFQAVSQNGRGTIYVSDRMAGEFPGIGLQSGDPVGAMVSIQAIGDLRAVFWFRQETVQTVQWAGDPNKTREAVRAGNQAISPRKSFKSWKEVHRGLSRPWASLEIESAEAIGSAILARWDHFMRLRAESALRQKLKELYELTGDLQNLFAATEIATIFLDPELRLLRFTPHVTRLFQVDQTYVGRPLAEFSERLGYAELNADAQAVLADQEVVEREIQGRDGTWYLMRMLPYRSVENRPVGIVVSFFDVHALKVAEHQLRLREQDLEKAAAHLEDRVRERTRQVRELSAQLTLAEQNERDRIAQILHDDIQQMLVSMQMRLHFLSQKETLPPEGLQDILRDLRRTMEIGRELTTDLSPPVLRHGNFVDTLHWLKTLMKDRYQLKVRVEVEDDLPALSKQLQVILFQIVRELLFNVVKHAQTSEAVVTMRQMNGTLSIRVEDHGKGFRLSDKPSPSKGSYGTSHIQEQLAILNSSLTIDSEPNKGCRATVQIPLLEQLRET